MKIALDKLTTMYREILGTAAADPADLEALLEIKIDQDLHDNYFSGVAEAESALKALQRTIGKQPKVEADKPSLRLIACDGFPTELATAKHLDWLCNAARANGIAILGLYGGGYQGGLDTYARKIAAHDLVGLVGSTGGPACVLPYGGRTSVTGTDPFAYGIPTNDLPIVFDAATAQYAYGTITRAKKEGKPLPEQAYRDEAGDWTTDAQKAVSIIPFGGHRGSAVNLLVAVMGGALVHAKSGLLQNDEWDLGSFLIAIDPSAFGPLEEFKKQTTQLVEDIQKVKPAEDFSEVRVPGQRSERRKQECIKNNSIEIADANWHEFEETYKKVTGKE